MDERLAEVSYCAGKLDTSLVLIGGNHKIYDFVGDKIYSALYKMVMTDEVDKLKGLVAICDEDPERWYEDCFHFPMPGGKQVTCLVKLMAVEEPEGYEIQIHNLSTQLIEMGKADKKLAYLRNFLTLEGDAVFVYTSESDRFELYWMDYAQRIDIVDQRLRSWEKQVLKEKQVTGSDQETFKAFCQNLRKCTNDATYNFHGTILNADTGAEHYHVKLAPAKGLPGVILGIWSVMDENVGVRQDGYLNTANLDAMTGILNKKAITAYAEKLVSSGQQVALVMMDIDDFKNINDSYGHLFGDAVIIAVADVIKRTIGEQGIAGRVGGDEFMFLVEDYGDEQGIRTYLRAIKMNVNALFREKVGEGRITCSMGVARSDLDGDVYKELVLIADRALYLAKEKGRNRYIIYKEHLHGQFHISDEEFNIQEIKNAFYSDKEMSKFQWKLAEYIAEGSSKLQELLELAAEILDVDTIAVVWGKPRRTVGATPTQISWLDDYEILFSEEYQSRFSDDILVDSNINSMEFSLPEHHKLYKKGGVCSIMQHYLRNENGEIAGIVSIEDCKDVRRFPKIAVQLFITMSRVINVMLRKEEQ